MTLSYFTGEQNSEPFEQIIHFAEDLRYLVCADGSKDSLQFDLLQAVCCGIVIKAFVLQIRIRNKTV